MDTEMQELVTSIAKEKHISGKWPLIRLLELIDALTDYDLGIEQKNKKAKNLIKVAVALVLLPIPGFIVAVNYNLSWLIPVLVILLVLGIPLMAFSIMQFVRNESKDLHDEFRTYLKPLLTFLQEDLKPGSPIAVSFYLSPIKQESFSQGKGPKYSKGAYPECYDHPYQRILLALKLRLQDGNRLMINVTEQLVVTSRTKKSASGKYKTKYKYRKRLISDIKVLINPGRFSCKSLPTDGESSFYIKERNNIPIIGLRAKQQTKSLGEDRMPLEHIATLGQIMTLYSYIQSKTAAPDQGNAPA